MIKKEIFIGIVTLVTLFLPTAFACDTAFTPTSTPAMPNTTYEFGVFNISDCDTTPCGIEVTSVTSIFNTTYNRTDSQNSSEFIFHAAIPEFFHPGIYNSQISFTYNNSTINQPCTITVARQERWFSENTTYNIYANSTETKTLRVNLTNNGNVEIPTTATFTGNCSDYGYTHANKVIYPNMENAYILTFDIPRDQTSGTENCTLFLANANNASQNQSIVIQMHTFDNIYPAANSTDFRDAMALMPAKLSIDATDNVAVKSVTAEISYNNQTTYELNGTIYAVDKNVSLGTIKFTQQKDAWLGEFTETYYIGKHFVNYTVSDVNNNTINGLGSFEVVPLEVITYNKSYDIGFVQKNHEISAKILSSSFSIPVTLSIVDVRVLDANLSGGASYIIGMNDFKGNAIYFNEGDELTFDGTGNLDMLFSANSAGMYIAKIMLSTVEQHIPISNISVSFSVVDFSPPYTHYENNPLPGVTHVCDLENTGILTTSVQTCITTLRYPYFLSEENIPIMKNLKEIEDERAIWNQLIEAKEDEIKSFTWMLGIISVMFVILLMSLVYVQKMKPFIFVMR